MTKYDNWGRKEYAIALAVDIAVLAVVIVLFVTGLFPKGYIWNILFGGSVFVCGTVAILFLIAIIVGDRFHKPKWY